MGSGSAWARPIFWVQKNGLDHSWTHAQDGNMFCPGPLARKLCNASYAAETSMEGETKQALRIATSARVGAAAWLKGWRRPGTRATPRRYQRRKYGVGLERDGPRAK